MGEMHGKKTKISRANQGCDNHSAPVGNCESGPTRQHPEFIGPLRVDRPYRTRRDKNRAVLGGIIAQLIEDVEDQLGDARECIANQEKRIARLERRLDGLRLLQELQEDRQN